MIEVTTSKEAPRSSRRVGHLRAVDNPRSTPYDHATMKLTTFGLAMLTCGLVGCGGSSPSSPSGPSATQPPPGSPRTTFGLSGTVTEVSSAGLTPLAGATVEILGHVGATNALGYYSLPAIELSGLPSS